MDDWTNTRPCALCGEPVPGGWALCAECEVDEYDHDPPELWTDADLDTDEELPCVHADGCPGHARCRVCLDY